MYKALLILAMTASCLTSMAQSESGLLLEAEAEKKLSKKFSVALDADMRTRNDFKTMDRWSIGIGGEYKPIKNLKLGAGYTLLNTNFREDVSFQTSGIPKKWRPSYWASVIASAYRQQDRISSATISASPCASVGNTPTVLRKP